MKKTGLSVLALSVALGLFSGCGNSPDFSGKTSSAEVQLTIFGAASLDETLTELGEQYMLAYPEAAVCFQFDSSGTLKTQIQEGAECDIFISAGQKQMDQLDITVSAERNRERLDFVLGDSRIDLLENRVVLAVPEGNPAGIRSFEDMVEDLQEGRILMAMGNEDVPAGQYGMEVLSYYGISKEETDRSGVITYGSSVREVTAQLREAAADCGIIYQTDAYLAGLTVVDTASAEMCGRVLYPAAVMKGTRHPDEAQQFLDFLQGETGDAVFTSAGFLPVV